MKLNELQWQILFLIAPVVLLTGCQSVSSKRLSSEQREAVDSMRSVTQAISGKTLTDEELIDLSRKIENDPEAKSAVESITQSLGGEAAVPKYCPVDGERFAPHKTQCPTHNVTLKRVDE